MIGMDEIRRPSLQFSLRFVVPIIIVIGVLLLTLPLMGRGLLLFLLGLGVALAALIGIGRYILGPLDQAARKYMRPTQFTMVDFLSLMFLFQLPMAALHARFDVQHEPQVWIFDIFGWIACTLMWSFSVGTLSRAGIEKTWQRGVFLAFVLPVTYFGSIVFIFTLFVATIGLVVERRAPLGAAMLVVGILGGLALAFYLSARFVRKMVAESEEAKQADSAACDAALSDLP